MVFKVEIVTSRTRPGHIPMHDKPSALVTLRGPSGPLV